MGAGPLVVTYPLTGRSRAIVEEELGGTAEAIYLASTRRSTRRPPRCTILHRATMGTSWRVRVGTPARAWAAQMAGRSLLCSDRRRRAEQRGAGGVSGTCRPDSSSAAVVATASFHSFIINAYVSHLEAATRNRLTDLILHGAGVPRPRGEGQPGGGWSRPTSLG
jgi:hypothetical protein